MAMLGSLADSGLDLLASLVVLAGVRIAAQPADNDHRFGHGKAEALAALVQVILITLSALFIGCRSVGRLIAGAQTTEAELGIGVSLVAIALHLRPDHLPAIRRPTDRLGRDLDRPPALCVRPVAQHVGDRALVLDQYAGLAGADAAFGLLIAAVAAVRRLDVIEPRARPADGSRMARGTAGTLPRRLRRISRTCRASRPPDADQRNAQFRTIPCVGAGRLDVAEAHERMDRIEEELQQRFPGDGNSDAPRPGRAYRPRNHVAAGNHGASVVTGIPFSRSMRSRKSR